jgi:hypothetical protein
VFGERKTRQIAIPRMKSRDFDGRERYEKKKARAHGGAAGQV